MVDIRRSNYVWLSTGNFGAFYGYFVKPSEFERCRPCDLVRLFYTFVIRTMPSFHVTFNTYIIEIRRFYSSVGMFLLSYVPARLIQSSAFYYTSF